MRKIRNTVLGASGLLVLAAVAFPGVASAQDTETTFVLAGGEITLTVPAAATLVAGTTGEASIAGSLGAMNVDDARGVNTGWGVTAGSSLFTDGAGTDIAASEVDYAPGAVTNTGVSTTTPTTLTGMETAATVVEATAASGNNTAAWTPTLTVGLPADALAGTYTGTVTTSLL